MREQIGRATNVKCLYLQLIGMRVTSLNISPRRTDHCWTARVDNCCYHPGQVVQQRADWGEQKVVESDEERFQEVVGRWAEQTAGHHPQHLVGGDLL